MFHIFVVLVSEGRNPFAVRKQIKESTDAPSVFPLTKLTERWSACRGDLIDTQCPALHVSLHVYVPADLYSMDQVKIWADVDKSQPYGTKR